MRQLTVGLEQSAHGRDGDRRAGGCGRLQAFEAAVIADYNVQSAVERELVLRLASLLWRLRRATKLRKRRAMPWVFRDEEGLHPST
jgi:hypothetical protein